ncbi:tetratricopeptide repeat-containing sensor histidine kinase, partial [Chryseobacterium taiwanense]|uniref:tetratricopeptide repeat-containing sensor histidine kinase n=1 Tax=Chryseobacterium taiwanense TaxID=363331 RepID=UPI00057FF0AC
MKVLISIIILLLMFSCKKDNIIADNNPNFHKAFTYRESQEYDSAFYYYNLAKNDFIETNDSIGTARSLINMAMIQTNKGEFLGGIESSLQANTYLKKESDSTIRVLLGKNYNNMAIASNYLKNFENAYDFYFKALKYIDNTEDRYLCYNNIGDVLINQGKPNLAKSYLEKAINVKDSINYSKALNNIAKAKYLDNPNYDPLPELNKALEIRKIKKDGPGQNSSFETLSSYYLTKDKNLSLHFAKKMLETAINNKSAGDQILALKRLIILDSINYLKNFQRLNSINDSLQIIRNKDQNQFAIIRFDVDKIKEEKEGKETEILQRNFGIGALSLLLVCGFFLYRKRKKSLQQEKELEIKETQLKMSKKVHDVVANGIYQVMTKIENQEHFDKEKALDELEFVYEKSRDISYDKADPLTEEKSFNEKISEIVSSFKNNEINTYLAGNDKEIWENLNSKKQIEVYQIIRELLVNMKKHSKADRVVFRFERENNLIRIFYSDNGVGISGDVIYKNGLSSTVFRIESIKGEITFDTRTEKGLKINISFPVF